MGLFDNQYIFFAVATVGIFTLYMAMASLFRRSSARERLLKSLSGQQELGSFQEPERSPLAQLGEALLEMIGADIAKIRKTLGMQIAQAGLSSQDAVIFYLMIKRFLQPLLLLAGLYMMIQIWLIPGLSGGMKLAYLVGGGLLAIGGFFGADLLLNNMRQKRQERLVRAFPDSLDLLLVCVEAGLALDGALARVATELKTTYPEITEELNRTRLELTVLGDRVLALQNLADRTGAIPFRSLVSSLIQTERFGTSLGDTLRVLSEDYRLTRLLNAENKAARMPALITIPMILCFLPAFMLVIVGPPMVKIYDRGGIFGSPGN